MKKKKVAEVIKQYLDNSGIKQNFVAEKIQMSPITLCDILNGKRKLIADEFVSIVLALNVDANYFIDQVNDSSEKE